MRNAVATKAPSFASLVQQFFTEYLVAQRALSPRTVACYRDALVLFLDFASSTLHRAPTDMRLTDLRPDLILAFLDHLERNRHNAIRQREDDVLKQMQFNGEVVVVTGAGTGTTRSAAATYASPRCVRS